MINVFNIEKFATHDGPGIRTTIFLKGCFLHCPWCANPESWSLKSTLLYDKQKCVKCKKCMLNCKNHAIKFENEFRYDLSKCHRCKKCVQGCFYNAIKFAGEEISIQDVVDEVLKDKEYYENSHGGITISGGEPFKQFESMLKLLKELKKNKLHIAIETTGNYELKYLKEALPYIDLFLFDIKHLDCKKLKDVTGANPNLIFTNLEYLASNCLDKIVIRVPVIPKFNYEKEILQGIIDYACQLGIAEVDLLPYHSLGKNKWLQLQKDYQYADLPMMTKDILKEYVEYGKHKNIRVKIGG
ncbi:glycyl-radical enzyme activating protein [Thomasclavelia saccharogumia]|uniref:glycyl-radical enzyme activating protein n=1 Tax=Thomasclavelia saccharogumia TaxID=341225 RepID=UPI00047B200E|nr:glycyl-radical enzyme activating protein [Thomasclavelia saccharogumia]